MLWYIPCFLLVLVGELSFLCYHELGTPDLRCYFLPRSFVVSHTYPHGQELIQCVRDTAPAIAGRDIVVR